MLVIAGKVSLEFSEDQRVGTSEYQDRLKMVGTLIAEHVIPRKLSVEGFKFARLAANEVVRNVLHGHHGIIEPTLFPDGSADLTTFNHKGLDLLTNECYSESVEIPHQGSSMIEKIVGLGNHIMIDEEDTFVTKTHFEPDLILENLRKQQVQNRRP